MTPLKLLALAVGFIVALPLGGEAGQMCDMQGKCWVDPDAETPPPAPQYPQADVGRSITVQPNAGDGCHLFRIRSVPTLEPQIVEICPIPPDEERAIRERADSNAGIGEMK